MALDTKSVEEVQDYFRRNFPDCGIGYTGRNEYGADEVYIHKEGSLQTIDLQTIAALSKKIGNTVSVMAQQKGLVTICYW